MIQCKICGNQYKRIDSMHLSAKHHMTVAEYLIMYPGSDVISKDSIEKYSIAQTIYAKLNPVKMQERSKKAKNTITPEQKQKTLNSMAKARSEKFDLIYGKDSLRNKKISSKTKDRWASYSEKEKSDITKKSAKTTRRKMGEDLYLEMMANKSISGYKTLVKNGRGSKWEMKMTQTLISIFPDAIADYQVGGRWYDAYIPSKNLLVEFDGDFWHPISLNDCLYEFQERNFHNDQKKNKIAIDNGYELIRIRQSESNKIWEI